MKITLSGVTHLIISLIVLVFSIAYRNIFFFSISLALMIIFYYEYKSFLEMERSINEIHIKRTIDRRICSELEKVKIAITIENKSKIFFPKIILFDILPRLMESDPPKPLFKIIISPESITEVEYSVKPLVPGVHDFKDIVIQFSDVLGYFYEDIVFENVESIVVLPLSTNIDIKLKSFQRILGVAIGGKAVKGMYDLANIREYVLGDDARKILWQIYAKTGKLMIREDFGETLAKILVLIDVRKNMWYIGRPPNTLAQIQLRYARSLIEYLVRNKCEVDIAICSSIMPKVIRNAEKDILGAIYDMISVLPVDGGCESPISIFSDSIKYLGKTPTHYDAIILVTNPISFITKYSPSDLDILLKMFIGKIVIAIPRYKYEVIIEEEILNRFLRNLSILIERSGLGIEIADEELYMI